MHRDTLLVGGLRDQPALHAVLAQIEAIGLELLELRRLIDELLADVMSNRRDRPRSRQATMPSRARKLRDDLLISSEAIDKRRVPVVDVATEVPEADHCGHLGLGGARA